MTEGAPPPGGGRHTSEAAARRLRRRYAAERRFRAYGAGAVLLAVAALGFLLVTIVSQGWPAFYRYVLELEKLRAAVAEYTREASTAHYRAVLGLGDSRSNSGGTGAPC